MEYKEITPCTPQCEIIDQTVQLEKAHSFDIDAFIKNPVYHLNVFFIHRLQNSNGLLKSVIEDIHQAQAQL